MAASEEAYGEGHAATFGTSTPGLTRRAELAEQAYPEAAHAATGPVPLVQFRTYYAGSPEERDQ